MRRLLRAGPLTVLLAALLGAGGGAPGAAETAGADDSWLKSDATVTVFYGSYRYDRSYGVPGGGPYGLRVGTRITPLLNLEIAFQRVPGGELTDRNSTLFSDRSIATATGPLEVRSESLQARLLIEPHAHGRRFSPYLVTGFGRLRFFSDPTLQQSQRGSVSQGTLIFGAGLRQYLTRYVALRFEYTGESAFEQIQINQQASVGISFELNHRAPPDSDRDGVIDFSDQCAGTPSGALVDAAGCPYDLDDDGVPEGLDLCPRTPGGWKVDADGCPTDEDGDKVVDALDACPGTIHGATVDARGCPSDEDDDGIPDGLDQCPGTQKGAQIDALGSDTPGCTHDLDGDGVPAGLDKCARTPAGAVVDASGCPIDSDGDGIYDGLDRCPDSVPGRLRDPDGCPKVRLDRDGAQILENVVFLKGTELYPGADAWIGLAAEALEYWSDLKVEIDVYTDAGPAAAQKSLAKKRAERIKAILVSRGIAADRIVAVGMGAVDFVAANELPDDRAKNNRVTVRRIEGDLGVHPPRAPAPAGDEPAAPGSGAQTP